MTFEMMRLSMNSSKPTGVGCNVPAYAAQDRMMAQTEAVELISPWTRTELIGFVCVETHSSPIQVKSRALYRRV